MHNPRNLFLGTAIVLVAVGLYFIPELAKVRSKGSSHSGASSTPEAGKPIERREKKKEADPSTVSEPLDRVLNKIDDGAYNSKKRIADISLTKKSPGGSFWDRITGKGEERKAQPLIADRDLVLKEALADGEGVTWATLAKPQVAQSIREGGREAERIKRLLDKDAKRSRAALDNYIKALNQLTSNSLRQFSTEEVFRYIANLDIEVTRAFIAEEVRRDVFKAWIELGLDSLVQGTGAIEFKRKSLPPFRGDIVLTRINLVDQIRQRSRTSDYERQRSSIDIRGVVIGRDATTIEFTHDGLLVKSINLGKPRKEILGRKFTFRLGGPGPDNFVSGDFVMKTLDKEGNFLEKTYRFLPAANRFRRTNGSYQIPPAAPTDTDVSVDRRLDSYFAIAIRGTGITQGATGLFNDGRFQSLNDSSGNFSRF